MPIYKVPTTDTAGYDAGPRRIRAPLRHSVDNGGSSTIVPRDCDVIGGDCRAAVSKSKRLSSNSNQVILSDRIIQSDYIAIIMLVNMRTNADFYE